MKLSDLITKFALDRGFYVTFHHNREDEMLIETFYVCADDFYEDASSKYTVEKSVMWIDVKNERLNIHVKDD